MVGRAELGRCTARAGPPPLWDPFAALTPTSACPRVAALAPPPLAARYEDAQRHRLRQHQPPRGPTRPPSSALQRMA